MQLSFLKRKREYLLNILPFFIILFLSPYLEAKSKWAIGIGTGWLQDYPGAAQGRIRFLPFPVYRGSMLRMDRISGVSGDVYKDSKLDFSWNFIFQFPTAAKDIPIRTGMPDLDWVFSLGPQMKYVIFQNENHMTYFRFPVRVNTCTNFGDQTRFCGLAFNPGIRHSIWYKNFGEFTFRFEAFSHSSEYQQYFFEVNPKYSTPSRPSFHARAGFLGFVGGLSHSIPFEGWEFSSSANVYDYSQAINDESPLFLHKTNYAVFFAFTIDI